MKYYFIDVDPEAIWYCIETGKDIEDCVPYKLRKEYTYEKKNIKDVLVEGETYKKLDLPYAECHAITNYGRLINWKTGKVIKTHYKKKKKILQFYVRDAKHYNLDQLDPDYDMDLVRAKYREYNWPVFHLADYQTRIKI